MQLEKLQIDLRPRSNAQALDLGFTLLRAHAATVYQAWLVLWLPLMALVALLSYFFEEQIGIWIFISWWLRPLFERAPLYVLSRQIFGEDVGWREALRAWPAQLKGGWFRLLTWWRPFMAGYGLYQPVWQLEMARGKAASERLRVVGAGKTGSSAFWFGAACFGFESVLQIGLLGLIGLFFSQGGVANPFAVMFDTHGKVNSALVQMLTLAGYAFSSSIMGPIYTACCFSLYLNRRAGLEAWDIEIVLRQIKEPGRNKQHREMPAAVLMLLAPVIFGFALLQPGPAEAAGAPLKCEPPPYMLQKKTIPGPEHSAEQGKLRAEVDRIFASDDMRGYECIESWEWKSQAKPEAAKRETLPMEFGLLAQIVKILFIAAAIALVGWLLYIYRDKFPSFQRTQAPVAATEVGGLDIRAESLPDDVAAAVRLLWASGERRAALALLYRATLSRLTGQDGLVIEQGATEGDCLRLARQACRRGQLVQARLDVTAVATSLWLNGAYGGRWPDDIAFSDSCAAWHAQFGAAKAGPP